MGSQRSLASMPQRTREVRDYRTLTLPVVAQPADDHIEERARPHNPSAASRYDHKYDLVSGASHETRFGPPRHGVPGRERYHSPTVIDVRAQYHAEHVRPQERRTLRQGPPAGLSLTVARGERGPRSLVHATITRAKHTPLWVVSNLVILLVLGLGLAVPRLLPVDAASGCKWYTVQRGDTLGNLGWTNHTTALALARANHIANANLIYVGQRICIPVTTWAQAHTAPALPAAAVPAVPPPPTHGAAMIATNDAGHYVAKYGFDWPSSPRALSSGERQRLVTMLPFAVAATQRFNARYGTTMEPQMVLWWTHAEGIGARVNYSNCANEWPGNGGYFHVIKNCDTPSFWQLGYGNQFSVIPILKTAFTDLYGNPNDPNLVRRIGQAVLNADRQQGTVPTCGGYSCSFPAMTIDQIMAGVSLSHPTTNDWWASVLSRDPAINCYMLADALVWFSHNETRNWIGCYYAEPCWTYESNRLGDVLANWNALLAAAHM